MLTLPESVCWKSTQIKVEKDKAGDYTLKVSVSGHKGSIVPLACSDFFLFATVAEYHLGTFPTPVPGTKSYSFKTGKLSAAERWDIENKGVRVFKFRGDATTSSAEVAKTLTLFTPLIGHYPVKPGRSGTAANLEFLAKYRNLTMKPRSAGVVSIDENIVQSGDFLGVMRLDGLDPMLAWGMGSTTGHTLIAMRDKTGQLVIAESTTNSSYWPTNGIQATPFATWLKQAEAAGYQVVHLPLTPSAAAKFKRELGDLMKMKNELPEEEDKIRLGLPGWKER